VVTHNPDLAARYARRVVRLVDGRVASDVVPGTAGARR
jgi:ABC-type cobalamin/Fe3+-siderophores transport system ATPase subunit